MCFEKFPLEFYANFRREKRLEREEFPRYPKMRVLIRRKSIKKIVHFMYRLKNKVAFTYYIIILSPETQI